MYVTILMDTDVFQILDHATPVRFTFKSVFKALGTLIAQGPRMLLADRRVERLDDVCKGHAIVFVQLAQVWLLVVARSVHCVRSLHRCGASAEITGGQCARPKTEEDTRTTSDRAPQSVRSHEARSCSTGDTCFGRETTAKRKTKTKNGSENALTTECKTKIV